MNYRIWFELNKGKKPLKKNPAALLAAGLFVLFLKKQF